MTLYSMQFIHYVFTTTVKLGLPLKIDHNLNRYVDLK